MVQKLTPATLRHQIAEKIRQAVLSGSLQPGEKLVERTIASQLGASVTVVREALIQLETEGFITKRPNSATHVTQLSDHEIEDILAVRRVLEGFAFELAATRVTPERVTLLEALHIAAADSAIRGNAESYIENDLRWHEAVWQTAGNDSLQAALRRLVLPLIAFSVIRVASRRGFDLLQDAQSHRPPLLAIQQRDPKEARKTFERAMDLWREKVLERPLEREAPQRQLPCLEVPGLN